MKFKEVFLVVVLILAGLVLFQFKTGNWDLDDMDWNWGDDSGFLVGREYAVRGDPDDRGSPAAGDRGRQRPRLGRGPRRRPDRRPADVQEGRLAQDRGRSEGHRRPDQVQLTAAADKLTLTTNRDEFRQKNFETGFVLTVPRTMTVRITNGYGVVRVDGVKEATVAQPSRRALRLEHRGPLHARDELRRPRGPERQGRVPDRQQPRRRPGRLGHGRPVASRRATPGSGSRTPAGRPTCAARTSMSTPARVAGGRRRRDVLREGLPLRRRPGHVIGHNMAVTAENVRGDLDVRTSYETVQARDVQGDLLVDGHNSAVDGRRASAAPRSRSTTSYENVILSDFSAEVKVVLPQRRCRRSAARPQARHGRPQRIRRRSTSPGRRRNGPARGPLEGRAGPWGLAEKPDVDQTNGESAGQGLHGQRRGPPDHLSTTYEDIRIKEGARKF